MNTCQNCGAVNPDQSKFCQNCGTPLDTPQKEAVSRPTDEHVQPEQSSQKACPRCGETYGPDEVFCASCGFNLQAAAKSESNEGSETDEQPETDEQSVIASDEQSETAADEQSKAASDDQSKAASDEQSKAASDEQSRAASYEQSDDKDISTESAAPLTDVISNEAGLSQTESIPEEAIPSQADVSSEEAGPSLVAEKPEEAGPSPSDPSLLDVKPEETKPLQTDAKLPDSAQAVTANETKPDIPVRKFCPRCGEQVSPESVFCRGCGYKLRKPAESTQGAVTSTANRTGPTATGPVGAAAAAAGMGAASYTAASDAAGRPPIPPQGASSVPPQSYPNTQYGTSQSPPGGQDRPPFAPPPPGAPYQPPMQASSAPYHPPGGQMPGSPGKPKKKKGLVVLIVLLVVVLAGAATWLLAGQSIRRMIMGDKAAYLAVEGKQLKDNADELAARLADIGNKSERPETGGHMMDISLDLPDYAMGIDPVMQSTLENINWKTKILFDQSGSAPQFYTGLDLQTGNEPLLSLEGYYDQEQLILGVPGILSKYIHIQREMIDTYSDEMGLDAAETDSMLSALDLYLNMDLGIDEVKLASSFKTMIDIVMDNIDEVDFSRREELTVDSVTQTYDRYTVVLGHESAYQMITEMLTFLRDDPEIFNLVSGIQGLTVASDPYYAEFGYHLTREDWQAEIDWMLDDMGDVEDIDPFTITQEVYVDGDDVVQGRHLIIESDSEGTVMTYKNFRPIADDAGAVEISFIAEGEGMHYKNTYSIDGDLKSGTISLSSPDEVILDVSYTDYQQVEIGSRNYYLGTFNFIFQDPYASESMTLSYSARLSGNQVVMSFGSPDLGSIQIGYEEVAAADVVFPSYTSDQLIDVTDYEALAMLVDEETMMELYRILQQLGFNPDDF